MTTRQSVVFLVLPPPGGGGWTTWVTRVFSSKSFTRTQPGVLATLVAPARRQGAPPGGSWAKGAWKFRAPQPDSANRTAYRSTPRGVKLPASREGGEPPPDPAPDLGQNLAPNVGLTRAGPPNLSRRR